MSEYVIHIPNWHPHRLNQLLKVHWSDAGRMKAGDMQMIASYGHKAGVTKATGKRRVEMTITLGKGQRGGDNDAYFKSTLDALVRLGYLKDDNRQWLDLEPVKYERAPLSATTIKIMEAA